MSTFRFLCSVVFSVPMFFALLFVGGAVHGLLTAKDRLPPELYYVSAASAGIFTLLILTIIVSGVLAHKGSARARSVLNYFSNR